MTSTPIGYFPKYGLKQGATLPAAAPHPLPWLDLDEICSVSTCIAKGPDRWTEHLRPNEFWGFESPEAAWEAVFPEDRAGLHLVAYKILGVRFAEGHEVPFEPPELFVEPMPSTFVRLGYDAVELCGDDSSFYFGCSFLSCNGQAGQAGITPVNRYCLISSEDDAFELARKFSVTKPEPGPYGVVEVWRAQPAAA